MQKINSIIDWLQKENYKRFYLALMRVLLSLFLLKEMIAKYPMWQLLYSNKSLLQFNANSAFKVLGITDYFLKTHYNIIIYSYLFLLLLFLLGIGKKCTVVVIFLLLLLLQKLNNTEVNGGDIMVRFLLFYFIFANSFQYLCIKKITNPTPVNNVVSNLAAYSMMIQLCVAYFLSFYHKIENPYWYNGSAMYYVFNTKAYIATLFNQTLSQYNWIVYFATYFTLFIELCFPIFIWHKKTRNPMLAIGLLLHLGIYFLMNVNNIQISFVLIYGLFFTTNEWLNLGKKIQKIYKQK